MGPMLKDQIIPILAFLMILIYLYFWNLRSEGSQVGGEHMRLKQETEDLIYDMRVLRSTRFGFAKRMEIKSRVKSFTVNALSVFSIFISVYLLANASGITEVGLKVISISIIGISLLALWMSLDTPSSELLRRSSDAHKCAREVSELYRSLKYDMISLSDAVAQYENIISRYPENHDPLDRAISLYQDRNKYPEKAKGITFIDYVVRYYLSCYSPAVLAFLWIALIGLVQIYFPV